MCPVFELLLARKKNDRLRKINAVIAIGSVMQGETNI